MFQIVRQLFGRPSPVVAGVRHPNKVVWRSSPSRVHSAKATSHTEHFVKHQSRGGEKLAVKTIPANLSASASTFLPGRESMQDVGTLVSCWRNRNELKFILDRED